MPNSPDKNLPWVGEPFGQVKEIHSAKKADLESFPGVKSSHLSFTIHEEPPGNPVSREFVITGVIDTTLTPEDIAKLPSVMGNIKIVYEFDTYRPIARPAYPARGE